MTTIRKKRVRAKPVPAQNSSLKELVRLLNEHSRSIAETLAAIRESLAGE